MARPSIGSGAVIDGFTIDECVHRGGMATLWSVTRPDFALPLRSLLGSVSSKVAAEAPCTVTVVRPPQVASPTDLEETSGKPDEARD